MGLAAFLSALVVYNNVANRWAPFNGWLFVPMNVAAAAAALFAGLEGFELSTHQAGIGFDWGGAVIGVLAGLAVVALVSGGLLFESTRRRLADERVAHLEGAGLVYQVIVRVPLGTALVEEIAFRGIAFGALRHLGDVEAALISSAAFGLWHISPTINLIEANNPSAPPLRKLAGVAGAVAFTSLAGLLLVWLRVETGDISAPLLLHAVVNGGATLVGVAAHRLLRSGHPNSIRPTIP
jgi:membrane protease YdiL (CAAX protease family)